MRRSLALAVTLPLIAAATGCGVGHSRQSDQAGSAVAPRAQHAGGSWPTYHRTGSRSGQATNAVPAPLHHAWTARLDGAVYGEPLLVRRTVVVATENDTVYGLDPATGRTRWRRHLGSPQPLSALPCGNIDPLGITGTPAYDAATRTVFVVAETVGGHHTLWALNASTGRPRWHRSTDVLPSRDRHAEQQRSALLVTRGRVITAYGGLAGDCGNYVGYLTSTATTGKGKTTHYAVPTSREGGIWAPPGPVVGANGRVYVATGNGAETGGRWDRSDSVTELTPRRLHRAAIFAPASWAADNQQDLDLGSSSPVPVSDRIVIAGKRGTVYLLRRSLGGVGSQVASIGGCRAFGGAARHGHLVVMPCTDGLRALMVHKHSLHWRWSVPGVYGSPVIAGHTVVVADRNSGTLRLLGLRRGHPIASMSAGSLTHFPSETVVGARIYVPTLQGVTAFRGS